MRDTRRQTFSISSLGSSSLSPVPYVSNGSDSAAIVLVGVTHSLQCRSGASLPAIGLQLPGGEHSSHTHRPHLRQWWRRLKTLPKVDLHSWQRGASLSGVHCTECCAAGRTAFVMGAVSAAETGCEPRRLPSWVWTASSASRLAANFPRNSSAAAVEYRSRSGSASHACLGMLHSAPARKRENATLPPSTKARVSRAVRKSSSRERTNDRCTPRLR